MAEIGYFLSSEEHGPNELVAQAQSAEAAGFDKVWISDHYHPWVEEQGASPFVWSVIGGIAATTGLHVTTAVTCPTMRIHPAVMAHATATASEMLDGRFSFGVGTGEALNEHILGDRWPSAAERRAMLAEAVHVIRLLWTGDEVSHDGEHYFVDRARLYTAPQAPPPIIVSAFGPAAVDLAAEIGDGLASTKPDKDAVDRFERAGGHGPKMAGLKVCWGPDEKECRRLAHRLWRSSGVPGELSQDLPTPSFFEQASELVTEDQIAEKIPCGPDPGPIIDLVGKYVDAGFDHVYLNQIGAEQDAFFAFYRTDLQAELSRALSAAGNGGRRVRAST